MKEIQVCDVHLSTICKYISRQTRHQQIKSNTVARIVWNQLSALPSPRMFEYVFSLLGYTC